MVEEFSWKRSQKKSLFVPSLYHLFFGEEEWRKIGTVILGRESLLQNIATTSASRKEIEERVSLQEEKGCYLFMIQQLALRALTEHEATKLLERYFVESSVIKKIVEKLIRDGYVSDEAIMESTTRRYIDQKKSRREIEARLWKRFGKPVAAAPFCSDISTLQNLIERKYRKEIVEAGDDYKKMNKLIAKLVRRGFEYDLVTSAIKQYLSSSKEL